MYTIFITASRMLKDCDLWLCDIPEGLLQVIQAKHLLHCLWRLCILQVLLVRQHQQWYAKELSTA